MARDYPVPCEDCWAEVARRSDAPPPAKSGMICAACARRRHPEMISEDDLTRLARVSVPARARAPTPVPRRAPPAAAPERKRRR